TSNPNSDRNSGGIAANQSLHARASMRSASTATARMSSFLVFIESPFIELYRKSNASRNHRPCCYPGRAMTVVPRRPDGAWVLVRAHRLWSGDDKLAVKPEPHVACSVDDVDAAGLDDRDTRGQPRDRRVHEEVLPDSEPSREDHELVAVVPELRWNGR